MHEPPLFPDREIIYKADSPGNAWSLYVWGPSKADPSRLPPDEPPFYASFMKKSKGTITALPFGCEGESSGIRVNWNEERSICEIYVGDNCYALFMYGTWRFRTRGYFRVAPQKALSTEDIEAFVNGRLPD